ncbi:hypothetical protein C2S53_007224 [Perilla frutescens var. hirtella]|uniref:Protein kinase domain-containing protein n=1 Tax=Perilla frutescens var. hirtella TaxID=608512 RepID=A0AAD4JEI1_PERFH|nr:hypothetical protein C2S53_007224 [Perilla frutescens var. hirtella]
MMISLDPNLRVFSYKELKAATRNFHRETVLGHGGFGMVYKGWIPEDSGGKPGSGAAVAVKKLDHESMEGFIEWKSEVKILGRLNHPNLEKLMGYGWNDEVCFLVISDSGFARTVPFTHDIDNHVRTWISVNRGYLAPEFIMSGCLTSKTDVYSFGVVLVEVMTGLRAFDYNGPTKKGVMITNWIIPHLCKRRKLKNIIDPRLKGRYCFESAAKIAHLALRCLQPHPATRPTMEEVVETLQKIDTAAHLRVKSRQPSPPALTT